MSKPVLVGVLIVVAVIAVMIYSSLDLASHRVEVCMEFNGRTNCKTASAVTEEAAVRAAITNACADMASGVTETMACERSEPASMAVLK